LVSFQANCTGDDRISVTWTTASEHNTSHFLVDRSKDGLNWMPFGEVAAAGNSTQLLNYNVIDIEKSFETNYYRLTQFDNNGDFKMFEPVSVNCNDNIPNNHITSYPNPSENDFYLSLFTETMEGLGKLTISDASGRSIYTIEVDIQQGNNVYFIEDLDAAPGIYYIQFSNGTTSTEIVKHSLR
jgi:hypothetical protein